MPAYRTNDFTLAEEKIEHGIEVHANADVRCSWPVLRLACGPEQDCVSLGMRGQPKNMPVVRDGRLISGVPADMLQTDGKLRIIAPADGDSRILLRIVATRLDFKQRKIMGRIYWPGGEALNKPLRQVGLDKNPDKDQLFMLNRGDHIYVIDSQGAVSRIDHQFPLPLMRPAIPSEFGVYVARYSARKIRALGRDIDRMYDCAQWAVRTLRALKCNGELAKIIGLWDDIREGNARASQMVLR